MDPAPDDDPVRRARELILARRYRDALEILEPLIERDPLDVVARELAAEACLGSGEVALLARAERYAREALAVDPSQGWPQAILGYALHALARRREAAEAFQREALARYRRTPAARRARMRRLFPRWRDILGALLVVSLVVPVAYLVDFLLWRAITGEPRPGGARVSPVWMWIDAPVVALVLLLLLFFRAPRPGPSPPPAGAAAPPPGPDDSGSPVPDPREPGPPSLKAAREPPGAGG